MRLLVAGLVTGSLLVFAGVALSAGSYSDPAGDNNAAPDVTSVTVSESADGTLTLGVAVGNFQALPANSWFNLWFDLDNDGLTGDEAGDDALVRYLVDGRILFYLWDGSTLVERASAGMTGRFEAGTLTVTVPKSAFGVDSFGVLAVSARGQVIGREEFIASDFAPDSGRSAWVGPASTTFPDPEDDEDAAPDITGVDVSDTKDGWIRFAISTPNYGTLPGDSLLFLSIDRDNRASTGDSGAEVAITNLGGEVLLQRWNSARKEWNDDVPPTRVRARNEANVVIVEVHRSELDDSPRFGFALVSADLNASTESVLAVDFAPDNLSYWRYALVNRALRLIAGNAFGTPASPRAGKAFTVSVPVRRTDTGRGITSGRVTCNVSAGGKKLRATGSVHSGQCRCAMVLPETARAVTGSMTVRSAGKSVTARFSFRVR